MADSAHPQFDEIDQAWTTIQDAFPDAFQNAGEDQKTAVISVRDMARDAWYRALNKLFHQKDPAVMTLTGDLKNENAAMSADLDSIKRVAVYLQLAKAAAKTAAALAALSA